MAKKRDRLQIIHDILKAIHDKNNRIRPTHILYKSNLSHQMMEEYLKELIGKNFVIENKSDDGKTYSLTQKGFDYLNKYKMIAEFTDSFGLEQV
jgi:predicted transcriptional regulator